MTEKRPAGSTASTPNTCRRQLVPAFSHFYRWVRRLFPLLFLLGLWQMLATGVTIFREAPFPTPWITFSRLLDALQGNAVVDYSIYRHTADSLSRWLAGFSIAAASGLLFGLASGWRPGLHRLTSPTVQTLQLTPGLAWIPVALLLFGIGENATQFMIAVTAFAPIATNVTDGVKRVDAHYIRAARMLGAGGGRLFFRVLLPGALPHIISGLRVGLGNSWRVLVAAEMVVGSGSGLGYAILQSRWSMDYAASFVCLIIICMVGLIFERIVLRPMERRTVQRWGLSHRAI